VFLNQFLDDCFQLGIAFRSGKYFFLLSGKVNHDFLFDDLLDFSLPGYGVNFSG